MRSHVTGRAKEGYTFAAMFQYRKRYEITCDAIDDAVTTIATTAFQYRKRYEITCDKRREYH